MTFCAIIQQPFYSKINQTHSISNLFYFGTIFYMFRMISPSIIRSPRLCIQHAIHTGSVAACKQPQNLYGMACCMQCLRLLMME